MILSWNTTKRCNLFCEHCYRESGPDADCSNELSTEEGKRLLDDAVKAGFKIIIFSGGDTLLRDDIFELIDHAYDLNMVPALGTNGLLVSDEMASRIKEHHVHAVSISLDSLDANKHDVFRRSHGSHALAIRGINECLKAGLKVQINFTITKKNLGELQNIIDYADSKSCSCFFFFLVDVGRGKDIYKYALNKEEYKYAIDFILDKSKEVSVELKPTCAPQFMVEAFGKKIHMRYTRGCIAGIRYCCILPNGDVHICPYSPVKAGSIRGQSFDSIWENSEIFNSLRNFHNYKGKCGGCNHMDICGGCRARAFSYTGDYLEEDVYCLLEDKQCAAGSFLRLCIGRNIIYTRKTGTISMIMGVYAIIMAITITPFSGLAIAIGGIAADMISAIFVRRYKTDKSIIICSALFPPCSLIGTLFVVTFLTTAKVHTFSGTAEILISLARTFLFSIIGSYISVKLLKNKINRSEVKL